MATKRSSFRPGPGIGQRPGDPLRSDTASASSYDAAMKARIAQGNQDYQARLTGSSGRDRHPAAAPGGDYNALTQGGSSRGGGMADLMDMLFGGGGQDFSAEIGASYDQQIAALMSGGERMAGLTDDLIGGIRSSAAQTNQNIGGFYDYAADAANAGRPVIAESGATAQGDIDSIYDDLSTNLGQIPGLAQGQASAAAGAAGGGVAERVQAAAAPFAAAGETGRAASKSNLAQHSAAGQDYLSQLAAAAPAEAAMGQQAVEGRAGQAVTSAQMALAEQQMQMEMQAAQLEGAKQRALIEHSADTAGSTFDRLMQTTQLYNALGADTAPLLDGLGLDPAPGGGMSYEDQLDLGIKEQRLADMTAPPTRGVEGFQAQLQQQTPTVQQQAMDLLSVIESAGLEQPEANQLIDRMTNDDGHRGTSSDSRLSGLWENFGKPRSRPIEEERAQSPEELLAALQEDQDSDLQMWTPVNPEILRSLVRTYFN